MPIRRRLGIIAFPAAAALAVLSGCSAQSSGSAAEATPAPGGSLTYAVSTAFGSFDPNVTASVVDARVLRQVYDSLVDLDAEGTVQPWLASAWEVSDDGLTYTFTLREDVTFQDGTAFDAEAVCYNFDRITDPATKSLYAVSLIGPYDSCSAKDPATAVVTLKNAYTPFLTNLSTPFLGMVSPTAAEASGLADFGSNPVGSGPFRFASYRPNSDVVLERNPGYNWAPESAEHQGEAYLEQLTFQIIADATVRLGSLRNGDVQAADDVPAQQVSTVKQDSSLSYLEQTQSGATYQLFFNTERPGLDDPAVRSALVKAMDLDSAVKATYFGAYQRAAAPLAPGTIGYDESVSSGLSYNAQAAADELTAAGWIPGADGVREKDGQRLELTYMGPSPNYDNRQELAEFLVQNLKDVGVGVDLELLPSAQAFAMMEANTFDIATTSFVAVDPDILSTLYSSGSIFNFSRTKAFDEDLNQAQTLPAGAEREALYAQIQAEAISGAYSVPVYQLVYRVATSTAVRDIGFDPAAYPKFHDTYLAQ
ncbi:ABC transporter substrate-binding protein [Kineosporia babensis]|uniref:ABC transporter substrate-binding protein n=1 Tax=Kineosporia babensis TaxID=499548 RepID=A0A9X1SWJ0_9ACTN|nr:ABC transporter substrate-binding protein [Kineosporia babensis]MCD5314816.1 ABC transporter substrate-binding protein [Kineosporia babensis]